SRLVSALLSQSAICVDIVTSALNPREVLPLGIAFSFATHPGYYVVCPDEPREALAVLEEFRGVFESEAIEKIGHKLKFDATLLRWHGIELRGKLMDIRLAYSMKEPEMRHGLDYLSKLYLSYSSISITTLIGQSGETQKSLRDVPLESVAEYACEEADVTLQVSHIVRPDIEVRGVAQVCYD